MLVDYSYFCLVNSDHKHVAKSCTVIDCTLGNSSKYVNELVR
jgi:hypothetical protein